MLNKINELISIVNWLVCNIKNIQEYTGTTADSSTDATISGRLKALEEASTNGAGLLDSDGKIKCEYIRQECNNININSWSTEEWPAEDSTNQTTIEEW